MKLLLLQPQCNYYIVHKPVPPIGLLYLAACCAEYLPEIEVKFFDEHVDKSQELSTVIQEFSPDIIGISVVSFAYTHSVEIAKKLKEQNKDVILIAGGPHATTLPETMLNNDFDFVVRGEGEETFTELLRAISDKKDVSNIKGISYKNKRGEIIHNQNRDLIKDLDQLPMVYEFFDPEMYPTTAGISSRGCPMKCAFCMMSEIDRHRVRFRTPENFVDELEAFVKHHNSEQFHLVDEQFTTNPKRAFKICELIEERELNISWFTSSRVDTVSLELLEKMKAAGCTGLTFSIESGSQKILDTINKNTSLEVAAKALESCKQAGIRCRTSWIVGLPGGGIEEELKSIEFMKQTTPDEIAVWLCTPCPGTSLWNNAEEFGIHIDYDNIDWDSRLHITNYSMDYLTKDEIFEIADKMVNEMRQQGYITSAENPSHRVSDVKLISTFLDEIADSEGRVGEFFD